MGLSIYPASDSEVLPHRLPLPPTYHWLVSLSLVKTVWNPFPGDQVPFWLLPFPLSTVMRFLGGNSIS